MKYIKKYAIWIVGAIIVGFMSVALFFGGKSPTVITTVCNKNSCNNPAILREQQIMSNAVDLANNYKLMEHYNANPKLSKRESSYNIQITSEEKDPDEIQQNMQDQKVDYVFGMDNCYVEGFELQGLDVNVIVYGDMDFATMQQDPKPAFFENDPVYKIYAQQENENETNYEVSVIDKKEDLEDFVNEGGVNILVVSKEYLSGLKDESKAESLCKVLQRTDIAKGSELYNLLNNLCNHKDVFSGTIVSNTAFDKADKVLAGEEACFADYLKFASQNTNPRTGEMNVEAFVIKEQEEAQPKKHADHGKIGIKKAKSVQSHVSRMRARIAKLKATIAKAKSAA